MSLRSRDILISVTVLREAQSPTLLRVLIYFLMMPSHQSNTGTELELIFLQGKEIGSG